MMPKNTGVVIFLLLFGLLFTGIGIGSQYSVMSKTEVTQGRIVEINIQRNTKESEHSPLGYLLSPVVEYTVEGKTLTVASTTYTYPFNFEVGDSIQVWYDPAKPEKMAVEGHDKRGGLNPLGVAFLYIGSFFTLASILWKISEKRPVAAKKALIYVLCLYWASFLIISRVIFFGITIIVILMRRDIKRHKSLIEKGEKIYADITECVEYQEVSDEGEPYTSYRLRCSYVINGETHIFKTNTAKNPAYAFPDNRIVVYYDKKKPSHYYVDINDVLRPDGNII